MKPFKAWLVFGKDGPAVNEISGRVYIFEYKHEAVSALPDIRPRKPMKLEVVRVLITPIKPKRSKP